MGDSDKKSSGSPASIKDFKKFEVSDGSSLVRNKKIKRRRKMGIIMYVAVSVGVAYWLYRLEKVSVEKHREATKKFDVKKEFPTRGSS
ncbi:MAG: hypothetical protein Q7S12_04590 [bacterium]|nr:hypothetical protein [bacterium]